VARKYGLDLSSLMVLTVLVGFGSDVIDVLLAFREARTIWLA
jgi:hypothetical protein